MSDKISEHNKNNCDEVGASIDDCIESRSSLVKSLTEAQKSPPSITNALTLTTNEDLPSVVTSRIDSDLLSWDTVGDLLAMCDLGIDYLAFSFQVRRVYTEDREVWEHISEAQGKYKKRYTTNMPLEKGNVYVQITESGRGMWGYVQFNPSTVIYGRKSMFTASLEQTFEVFHDAMDELDQIIDISTPRGEVALSRVDVSVTIPNVLNTDGLILEAAKYPYNNRLKTATYQSTKRVESVLCKSRNGAGFSIYNKSIQARLPGSALRFEAVARRPYLKQVCPTIQELTQPKCREIFENYINKVITALQDTQRIDIDNILSNEKDTKTLIQLVGISGLADRGYHIPMSDYYRNKVYGPFKKKYPHKYIGDFLGG